MLRFHSLNHLAKRIYFATEKHTKIACAQTKSIEKLIDYYAYVHVWVCACTQEGSSRFLAFKINILLQIRWSLNSCKLRSFGCDAAVSCLQTWLCICMHLPPLLNILLCLFNVFLSGVYPIWCVYIFVVSDITTLHSYGLCILVAFYWKQTEIPSNIDKRLKFKRRFECSGNRNWS